MTRVGEIFEYSGCFCFTFLMVPPPTTLDHCSLPPSPADLSLVPNLTSDDWCSDDDAAVTAWPADWADQVAETLWSLERYTAPNHPTSTLVHNPQPICRVWTLGVHLLVADLKGLTGWAIVDQDTALDGVQANLEVKEQKSSVKDMAAANAESSRSWAARW